MNEVLQAIAERYSCRDFTGAPISPEQVQALVDAALAAPSAMNRMPWHIVAVTDKAMLDEMDEAAMQSIQAQNPDMYNRMKDRGGKMFYNAPCLIFIAKEDNWDWAPLDCGIVSQNVALAAHALGLGSVICGMARIPLDGPNGEEWARRLQIPAGHSFGMSVCVGHVNSSKKPHVPKREKVTYIQ